MQLMRIFVGVDFAFAFATLLLFTDFNFASATNVNFAIAVIIRLQSVHKMIDAKFIVR